MFVICKYIQTKVKTNLNKHINMYLLRLYKDPNN